MPRRYELTDKAWDVVSDLFIETHGRGLPRVSDRLMLDGVLWVLCSGTAWRDMPERFGSWATRAADGARAKDWLKRLPTSLLAAVAMT